MTAPATDAIFEGGIGITPPLESIGGLGTEDEANRSSEGSAPGRTESE